MYIKFFLTIETYLFNCRSIDCDILDRRSIGPATYLDNVLYYVCFTIVLKIYPLGHLCIDLQ